MKYLESIKKETWHGIGYGVLAATFVAAVSLFAFWPRTSNWERCERAVPYALITEVRSVGSAIMCQSVADDCNCSELGLFHYHKQAQEIAVFLFLSEKVSTRERAVNDAFDAVTESTGYSLSECRAREIITALEYDDME